MRTKSAAAGALIACCALIAASAGAHPAGPAGNGAALLPNGRRVTPAGTQIRVGGWPQAMAMSPDGSHIVTANTPAGPQSISWIDASTDVAQQIFPVYSRDIPPGDQFDPFTVFAGLAFSRDGARLWVSGGSQSDVMAFDVTPAGPVQNNNAMVMLGDQSVVGPLSLSPDGTTLYTVDASSRNERVYAINVGTSAVTSARLAGERPFAVLATADRIYVAGMRSGDVVAMDRGLNVLARVHAGTRPMAMALAGDQLLVADANTDTLKVIDPETMTVVQSVDMAMLPGGDGSSPNAISVQGDRAAVTLGGVNGVAMLSRSAGTWHVDGMLPTGWSPGSVSLSGSSVWVGNLRGEDSWLPYTTTQNLGPSAILGFAGTVSHIPIPTDLGAATAQVLANAQQETQPAATDILSPSGPIKHVVFILRENKTFDADLGDTPGGSPAFVEFPRANTPSLHAMADRFGVLTDFYADGEASDEGHEWATGGYVTDFADRFWQAHGVSDVRVWSSADPMNYPAAGYIFDAAQRAGISWRDYGEFMRKLYRGGPYLPELAPHRDPDYPGWDQSISDTKREAIWEKDFHSMDMPAFSFIWLPNDHGFAVDDQDNPTLQQQVADNDLATGRVVDAISHSPYWNSTAIFLTEDDPQSAVDHVESHRTVGVVISPWAKHGTVDVHSDTSGMVRTMEMILGLAPINQFDANARPLAEAFTSTPDFTPFDAPPLGFGIPPAPQALARAQAIARATDHSAPDQIDLETQLNYTSLSVFGITADELRKRLGITSSAPLTAGSPGE